MRKSIYKTVQDAREGKAARAAARPRKTKTVAKEVQPPSSDDFQAARDEVAGFAEAALSRY